MSDTVKPQKNSKIPKIVFDATTDEEKNYLVKLEGLLSKKRRGDWGLVAEILKILPGAAEKSFLRVHSKNHADAVKALEDVITNRNKLFK